MRSLSQRRGTGVEKQLREELFEASQSSGPIGSAKTILVGTENWPNFARV